jgi:hypothetical protein
MVYETVFLSMSSLMIYDTVYGNELTLLAPWLMGQCHLFCFHGTWNQSARLVEHHMFQVASGMGAMEVRFVLINMIS